MGLFSRSYYKEGPGVDPDEPQKRSFFRFFDIFKRKIGHFARANLIYSLVCIPMFIIVLAILSYITSSIIALLFPELTGENVGVVFLSVILSALYIAVVGVGPITAGFTYIMRNYAREEHAWLWSDFKDTVKKNFKQSIAVFAIDIVVLFLIFFASFIYLQLSGGIAYLRYILYIIGIVYAMMHFYIYQIMITFDMSVKEIMKNSFIFTLIRLPMNIFFLIIQILVHVALPIILIMNFAVSPQVMMIAVIIITVLEISLTQSFTSFMVNFGVQGTINKFMMNGIEEKTAENNEEK